MGGGKGGGGEAAAARDDEQKRQAEIRAGTARVNSIFDGGTVGSGALAADTAYNPAGAYFNADGTQWTPSVTAPTSTARKGMPAPVGLTPEQQFAQALSGGKLYSGTAKTAGFDDNFFNGRRQAYLDYATPQLEDQYGDAQKQLTFALARNGTLDSSVRAEKAGELQKKYDLNKQQIGDQALASETDARNAIEDARANLISTLNATGDATGVANQALTRASVLSKPAAYSPIASLFSDFTSTLGTQAALERANAYSGGQTGVRYNTGLFAPSAGSVVVK